MKAKKIRQEIRKHYSTSVQDYFDVVARMSLKGRLKIAWMIVRNKRKAA